jgi:hypothetical protein
LGITVTLGTLVLGGLILYSLIDFAPVGAFTHGAGTRLSFCVLTFARSHDRVPASLDELAASDPSARQWLKDEWGRQFLYSTEPDAVVTITSLGRDAKPGGEHADIDRVWKLHLTNARGEWIDTKDDKDLSQWVNDLPAAKY